MGINTTFGRLKLKNYFIHIFKSFSVTGLISDVWTISHINVYSVWIQNRENLEIEFSHDQQNIFQNYVHARCSNKQQVKLYIRSVFSQHRTYRLSVLPAYISNYTHTHTQVRAVRNYNVRYYDRNPVSSIRFRRYTYVRPIDIAVCNGSGDFIKYSKADSGKFYDIASDATTFYCDSCEHFPPFYDRILFV